MRFNKTLFKASLVFITLLALHYLLKPELVVQQHYSQVVYDDQGRLLRMTLAADDKYRLYLPLQQISAELIATTLLYEDRYFYSHPGFNPVALAKAFWTTYVSGHRRVGASTITMQLARMRFDLDTRSISGKLWQLVRAVQLEWYFSKDEILEAYLNSVPYGGNIEGIAAASLIYFDKHPSQLNLHEALTLSVVPQNPQQRRPDNPAHSDQAQQQELQLAREQLLQRWLSEHPADQNHSALLALPAQVRPRVELPFSAPHLVNHLLQSHPHTLELKSTLNSELQNLLERNARAYIESQRVRGVRNTAVMLLNHRDMAVKAYLGSVDFNNVAIQGQVDGTAAKRSPGSSLKPFIYALGMDQGLIHPLSMLKDTPTSFGEYNPENFDEEFSGPVSVRDALIKSRNLPAVQVASQLNEPDLYDFLKSAQVLLPESRKHYGLSLVLGGAEVTMQELVGLYALLANKGVYHPLRFLQDDARPQAQTEKPQQLLSPDASFMVLDILGHNPRPAQSFNTLWLKDDKPVYWKTGTSYAYRDAWSVAVFDDYVLAVWVGNFDGASNNAFVGRDAAAPLLFRIIDAIRSQATHQPVYKLIPADKVQQVKLCAVSGQIPTKACKHQVSSWFIPGVSPIHTCDIHREILIDKHTGLRACLNEPDKVRSEVYEFWSSDLLKIFKQAGIPRRVPPPYLPACGINQTTDSGIAPTITSPRLNISYQVRHGKQQEKIPFIATTDADVQQLYWFLDETFIGKAARGKPLFWQPKPGSYVVRVIDDLGRGSSRPLKVELVN